MYKGLKAQYETSLISKGDYQQIIGIDEVGRGCWAGPVAVGGYVVDMDTKIFRGINDSKLLKAEQREKKYKKLGMFKYKVRLGSIESINKIGIGRTIENLISEMIEEFQNEYFIDSTFFLIDGQFSRNFGKHTKKAIKADSTYYCVAAASIMAKVERDRLMTELHKQFPQYGFNRHKGYGTKAHQEVIKKIGCCELHRTSFEPIRNQLQISL